MKETIYAILTEQGRLRLPGTGLADDADLYQLGLTSHASVNVMLALEDAFDVEFPNRMMRKSTFQSVASITAALVELGVESTPV